MGGIDDAIAGRFRRRGEYVRVGAHIAPAPEQVERMMGNILVEYSSDLDSYFLDKMARFHLDFEVIHPFCDGNGRIGQRPHQLSATEARSAARYHPRLGEEDLLSGIQGL